MTAKRGKGTAHLVHGYAAKAKGRKLEPYDYPPPRLKRNEVRVDVTHCGICYSDVHAIDDFYGITPFPFVPGHEVVGRVSEIGAAVKGLKIGDRVGMGWQARSCGKCEWCRKGEEQLCDDVDKNGVWMPHGGFASSVTADHRFVYPIPKGMSSEDAAVMLCAGATVYTPLKAYKAGRSSKVCVVGVGGLGHLAIQFAHALGSEVTVVSTSPKKEREARRFGADDFAVAGDSERLKKLIYTFDLVIYASHADIDWTRILLTVKTNGRMVLVGFPPKNVSFDAMEMVVHQQSMTGSFLASMPMMRETLRFAQRHGIKPMLEVMPMSKANEAVERLRRNKARYRIVLVNEGVS